MLTFDPTLDFLIHRVNRTEACEDDGDDNGLFVCDTDIATVLYGKATPKELGVLASSICQFRKKCDVLDEGIALQKGSVISKDTKKEMPRLLSIDLAINILNQSRMYKQLKRKEYNKLNAEELIARCAVAKLTERIETSLEILPDKVYDLVKSIALNAVGENLNFIEKEVAGVVNAVFTFHKDLSKFKDCEAVRSLACQVSNLFDDKNPRKRSATSQEVVHTLFGRKKAKKGNLSMV